MGCIRVDKITEYLCDPLQRCLKVSNCSLAHCMSLRLPAPVGIALQLEQEDTYKLHENAG